MNLQIDFYEKDQIAVVVGFDSSESFPEQQFLELLLFACFTLRQFHNLSHNTASDAFAGLLIWEEVVTELIKDYPEVPPVIELLVKAHLTSFGEEESAVPGLMTIETTRIRSRFHDDSTVRVVQNDYLSKIPQIINYQGKPTKKRFIATMEFYREKRLPDFTLHPKGFGILGWGVNYYASHSIIALLRFLARKYSNDQGCLERLSFIAKSCGMAHMQSMISVLNQPALAVQIVEASENLQ